MSPQAAVLNRSADERKAIEDRFQALAEQWKRETLVLSNPTAMGHHPAYREIVRLGPDAIPLILAELAFEPDFWFAALHQLTGASPETPEMRGKIHLLSAAWLNWGREHGYEC